MFYSCQMCMCVVNMAINKGPGANLNEEMSPCFITTKLNIFSSKYQQYYTQSLMLNNGRINMYFQEKKGRKNPYAHHISTQLLHYFDALLCFSEGEKKSPLQCTDNQLPKRENGITKDPSFDKVLFRAAKNDLLKNLRTVKTS